MKKLLLIILLICVTQINAQLCFNPFVNYNAGTQPRSICSADFNGDGKKDLAVANNGSGDVSIFLGTLQATKVL